MASIAALSGFLSGVLVKSAANAIRRVPISREPWEHLLLGVGGATVFVFGQRWNAANQSRLSAVMDAIEVQADKDVALLHAGAEDGEDEDAE